jgi:hypothetical protein
MNSGNQIRVSSTIGMASAVLWLIALSIEYRYGLQPPGNGSVLYYADQALFFTALAGYLIMLLGLRKSKAAGVSILGKTSVGIFIAALIALLIAQVVQLLTKNPDFFLYPVGGILQLLGGLLTGIAVLVAKRWDGWQRYAPLLQGLYYLMLFVLLIVGTNGGPTKLGEALWQVTWFITSLALFTTSSEAAAE